MDTGTSGRSWWLGACLLAAGAALFAGGCGASPATKPAQTGNRTYAFWPLAPDEPRIQFLRTFNGSDDISGKKAGGLDTLVFGKEGNDEAGIRKPYGLAMHDGKIYVADIRAKNVMVLDLKKSQTRLMGGSGANRLSNPVDVAVADDGMIYVADNERGAILVYDAGERYSATFGHPGMKPVAVTTHGDRLYVCDMNAHAVEMFDRRSGSSAGLIGSPGDEDGQFRVPLGVATDAAGNVTVVDMMRCRVQRFAPDGKFLSGVGTLGDFAGSFARPKQVAIDREGITYVVDASFQNVQMFNDKNELLMSFGAPGNFPGAMNLPAGITVCDEGLEYFRDYLHPGFEAKRLVLVTNQFGDSKVSVYAMGERKASYPLADLSRAAARVESGVGTMTKERERMQGVGTEEPPQTPAAPAAEGGAAAPGAGKAPPAKEPAPKSDGPPGGAAAGRGEGPRG